MLTKAETDLHMSVTTPPGQTGKATVADINMYAAPL
jgi:hypothetical protein